MGMCWLGWGNPPSFKLVEAKPCLWMVLLPWFLPYSLFLSVQGSSGKSPTPKKLLPKYRHQSKDWKCLRNQTQEYSGRLYKKPIKKGTEAVGSRCKYVGWGWCNLRVCSRCLLSGAHARTSYSVALYLKFQIIYPTGNLSCSLLLKLIWKTPLFCHRWILKCVCPTKTETAFRTKQSQIQKALLIKVQDPEMPRIYLQC